MARRRSAAVTTMGVLNLTVGGLGLLFSCCSGAGLAFTFAGPGTGPPGGLNEPVVVNAYHDMWEFMRRDLPLYGPAVILGLVMSFLTSVVWLVTGIGLLNRKNWARVLCVGYCVLNLMLLLADLLFRLLLEMPAQERWHADFLRRYPEFLHQEAAFADVFVSQLLALGINVGCILYTLLLLVVLLLPRVSAELSRRPAFDYYRDDFDDFEPRRRDWRG